MIARRYWRGNSASKTPHTSHSSWKVGFKFQVDTFCFHLVPSGTKILAPHCNCDDLQGDYEGNFCQVYCLLDILLVINFLV